ncbi:hypothetical protein TYRP_008327 [Tyrophagus putrescentiae]|nr:hypothetical protein TYRP_008327 [Tyrophagus putrescentiae]
MEIVVWLIFILATLFILITLALVNCAELPEDHSTEKKKNTTPIPKGMSEKAHAAPISKQKVPPCAVANAPTAHGKVPPVKKSVKNIKKEKTFPKVSGGHSQPTLAVVKTQRTLAKSKHHRYCEGRGSKAAGTKPGAKPKLPYHPELGPLLVDQEIFEKLAKKYDLNGAPPSTTEGKSSSLSHVRSAGSDGSSHLSRFKTQSFGGSLSKCSTKLDPPSAIDGATVEKSKKELVKEAKQQQQ